MELDRAEQNRRIRILAALALLAGAYVLVCEFTEFRIPCVFHEITGLDCPGCGTTRMCMHLLHLEFGAAFRDNPAAFLTAPFLLYLAGCTAAGYAGVRIPDRAARVNTGIAIVLIAVFLVFGVLRNLI